MAELAFTPEELEQRKKCQVADIPCQVTADMYFPSPVAEAKSSERTLAEAERQVTQGAAIAVRAVVERLRPAVLRLKTAVSTSEDLTRE